MYVLDTGAWVHALKGQGQIKRKIESVRPSALAVPAIVAYQLEHLALRAPNAAARRRTLSALWKILRLLPFDRKAASAAARIRLEVEKNGHSLGEVDLAIAATVIAHGATLVTHDTDKFACVPGLSMEDWFEHGADEVG